jgi:NDP-sugar pyrophosphorylase family protein
MKAMILAAGEGTRLRPLTDNTPKVLVEINGKPILEHNINLARQYGVRDIIINVCYKSDQIMNYFQGGAKFGVSIVYSREEELLGSAGGVKKVEKELTESFFLLYGDNVTNCNLDNLLLAHQKNKTICTMAIHDMTKNKNSGIGRGRVLLNSDRSVKQFMENADEMSNLVSAGSYILEPEIFKYIPEGQKYDFGWDVFPSLLRNNIKIGTYQFSGEEYVFGCDNTEGYHLTQDFFTHLK